MLMFFSGLIFILIVLFFAMRAEEIFVTDFELERRISTGDKRAVKLLLKKQLIPTYNFVIKAILAILAVVLVLLISQITGPVKTFFISSFLIIVAALLSRSKLAIKISKEVFSYLKPYLLAIYERLGQKTKRRIVRQNKQRNHPVFYSKSELLNLISKNHQKVLSSQEEKWLKLVFDSSNKTVSDLMIPRAELRILHQTELLGPLVIDEMHKTGQDKFVVTQKNEEEIMGVISLEKVATVDNKTSQVAKNVMDRDFLILDATENQLEAFEKMIDVAVDFAVVRMNGEFVGVVNLRDFIKTLL